MFMLSQKDMDRRNIEIELYSANMEYLVDRNRYVYPEREDYTLMLIENIKEIKKSLHIIPRHSVKEAIKRKIKAKALYNSIGV